MQMKSKFFTGVLAGTFLISQLSAFALWDPDSNQESILDWGESEVRITNISLPEDEVYPDYGDIRVISYPSEIEGREPGYVAERIIVTGVVKFNDISGGFYEVDGYRLVGEEDFSKFEGMTVRVSGEIDTSANIFMTKGIIVHKIYDIEDPSNYEPISDADIPISYPIMDMPEPEDGYNQEKIIIRGKVTFNNISGGFYEVNGFRLVGEEDFSTLEGKFVSVAGTRDYSPSIYMTRGIEVIDITELDQETYKRAVESDLQNSLLRLQDAKFTRDYPIAEDSESTQENSSEISITGARIESRQLVEELVKLEGRNVNMENYRILGTLLDTKEGAVNVYMNGRSPIFEETALPFIQNGRTLMPLRALGEEIGAEVTWNESDRKVFLEKDGVTIELKIDSNIAYVNGEEVELELPATIVNGRTFVPARFIGEVMDINVEWVPEGNIVLMSY